jgi:hypothetical protein
MDIRQTIQLDTLLSLNTSDTGRNAGPAFEKDE